MKTVLFLSIRMCPGWGVSVVLEHLSTALRAHGIRSIVGCLEQEGRWSGAEIRPVAADAEAILELVEREGVDVVVANTSPYFEVLPLLQPHVPCIAYEYGDPTPQFFGDDELEREAVAVRKRNDVYPVVSAVIAGSEFLSADIDWPVSEILYCGCDHMPDPGRKGLTEFLPIGTTPLRVGTLARLGHGEARYKGNALYRELVARCAAEGIAVQCEVMGRGVEGDALPFEREGIVVHLNGTEGEKADYLRRLDVFVSCSQWEGFNLPLAEAAALGTAAIAFDVGAHPEVTPLLLSNLDEAIVLLRRYSKDRALLSEHSNLCYEFVRSRFRWERTALAFSELCRRVAAEWSQGAVGAAPFAGADGARG